MREYVRAPRKYELMTILHPEVAEEALPAELDRISGYLDTIGAELIDSLRDSPWGRRRLAYPIRSGGKDVRDGYYTVWHFSVAPTQLLELERELKLNTQVIRYIMVNWEPKPIDPKEVEAAEIAAEEAAAQEYRAAEAAAAAAEADAADAFIAETAVAEAAAEAVAEVEEAVAEAEVVAEIVAAVEVAEAVADEAVAEAEVAPMGIVAQVSSEAEAAAADDIPAGAIRGVESGECPEDYPVKGNQSSKLYHTPGSPFYDRTIPEFCFASTEAAEAAGFNPTKYEAAHEAEGE